VIARVREFALDLLEPNGIELDFETPPGAERARLAPEQRRHLYLILKESVHNVARHAQCRRVSIALRLDGRRLHAEVADDGRGFEAGPEAGARRAGGGGHGLPGMRERARQMRGSLEVRSAPGEGTVVILDVPCRSAGA
jgi:signal transduction histidine kinase